MVSDNNLRDGNSGGMKEMEVMSYLLIADATLEIYEATTYQVNYLSLLLKWSEAMHDLRINLEKHKTIHVARVEDEQVGIFIKGFPMWHLTSPTYCEME